MERYIQNHNNNPDAYTRIGLPCIISASNGGAGHLVRRLIEMGAKLDVKDRDGQTAMDWAAKRGHSHIARIFMEHGCDTSAYGWTPLHLAVIRGEINKVRGLAQIKKLVCAKDANGLPPLYWAASCGDEEIMAILLQYGAKEDVHATDSTGVSVLHAAAGFGTPGMVKLLLDHGAELDASNDKCIVTPLASAVFYGKLENARLLLERGADIHAPEDGTPVLHAAAQSGDADAVRFVLDNGGAGDIHLLGRYGYRPLHWAAESGDPDTIRLLLKSGADEDIHSRTADGLLPLHMAAGSGNPEAVRLLLENGAESDVNARASAGQTPLLCVGAFSGDVECARILLEKGADLHAKANKGETVLAVAAGGGCLSLLTYLLENGAASDVNVADEYGNTPLLSVAFWGDGKIVTKLIDAGADVSAKDKDGWTPLHAAAMKGNVEVVRLLIMMRAEVDARTSDSACTPLHLAASYADAKTVKLLLRHGADISACDNSGDTPLQRAQKRGGEYEKGKQEVIRLLEKARKDQ